MFRFAIEARVDDLQIGQIRRSRNQQIAWWIISRVSFSPASVPVPVQSVVASVRVEGETAAPAHRSGIEAVYSLQCHLFQRLGPVSL